MKARIICQRMKCFTSLRFIRPNASFSDFFVVKLLFSRQFVGGELLDTHSLDTLEPAAVDVAVITTVMVCCCQFWSGINGILIITKRCETDIVAEINKKVWDWYCCWDQQKGVRLILLLRSTERCVTNILAAINSTLRTSKMCETNNIYWEKIIYLFMCKYILQVGR